MELFPQIKPHNFHTCHDLSWPPSFHTRVFLENHIDHDSRENRYHLFYAVRKVIFDQTVGVGGPKEVAGENATHQTLATQDALDAAEAVVGAGQVEGEVLGCGGGE